MKSGSRGANGAFPYNVSKTTIVTTFLYSLPEICYAYKSIYGALGNFHDISNSSKNIALMAA